MNEEMKTFEEIENTEVNYEDMEPETSDNGIVGKVMVGLVLAVGGAAAFVWHKTADKREERAIRKLEKKGYVITKVIEDDTSEEDVSEDMEDTEENNG